MFEFTPESESESESSQPRFNPDTRDARKVQITVLMKRNTPHIILFYVCVCVSRSSARASWEIARASVKDEGLYECVARSVAGVGRALTHLTVTGTHTHTHTPATH